jgi:hypothetical protein
LGCCVTGTHFGNKCSSTLVDALWLEEEAGYSFGDSFDACARAELGASIVHVEIDSSFAPSEKPGYFR